MSWFVTFCGFNGQENPYPNTTFWISCVVTAISVKFHTIHRRKFMPNVFPTKLPAKGLLTFRSCEKKKWGPFTSPSRSYYCQPCHGTFGPSVAYWVWSNAPTISKCLSSYWAHSTIGLFCTIALYNALNKNINIYLYLYIYIYIQNRDSANFVAILWCLGKYMYPQIS